MSFYGLIEKNELKMLIRQAKKTRMEEVIARFESFEHTSPALMKAVLPEGTPDLLIKKRSNKLARMKRERELKRLFG